jgi:hypothetical protein
MNYDDYVQAAEQEWLESADSAKAFTSNVEDYYWHWFWLILASANHLQIFWCDLQL